MTEKACRRCGEVKPILTHYSKNKSYAEGYCHICKACQNTSKRKPELVQKRRNKYKTDDKEWIRMNLQGARHRARKQNLPFDLTVDDLTIPKFCPVLGIEIQRGTKGFDHNSPTIDKIIPELGYVKGNTQIVSWLANKLKSDCIDPNIFRKIADYLENVVRT